MRRMAARASWSAAAVTVQVLRTTSPAVCWLRRRAPVPAPGIGARWRRRRPGSRGSRNLPRRKLPRFYSSVAWCRTCVVAADVLRRRRSAAQARTQRSQHSSRAGDKDAPTPRELRHWQTRFGWNREGGRKKSKPPTLGIVYKFSIKIRPMPLAVSAGNIPGRIPDAPASA